MAEMDIPEFADWTSPSGLVGGGSQTQRIMDEIEALKNWTQSHAGLDAWAAGPDYPHPSQRIRSLYFFEGNGRLNENGFQLIAFAPSVADRGIYWLQDYSPTPSLSAPAVMLTGYTNQLGTLPANAQGVWRATAGVNSTELRVDIYGNSSASIMDVLAIHSGNSVHFLVFNDTSAAPMNRGIGVTGGVLWIGGGTSDLGMNDGALYFRTDTFKFRARANGVTENLATEAYVTTAIAAIPADQDNIWPYAAKTTTYITLATDGFIRADATAGNFVITLITAVGNTGLIQVFKKIDATNNTVTLDANTTQTIDGALTYVLSTEDQSVTIISDGANWHVIASSSPAGYAAKTTTYTALPSDTYLAADATSGSFTITLYPAIGNAGRTLTILKPTTNNVVTIDGNAAETISGQATYALSARYSYVTLLCTGTAWFIVGAG